MAISYELAKVRYNISDEDYEEMGRVLDFLRNNEVLVNFLVSEEIPPLRAVIIQDWFNKDKYFSSIDYRKGLGSLVSNLMVNELGYVSKGSKSTNMYGVRINLQFYSK